jgi:hypothetical protein
MRVPVHREKHSPAKRCGDEKEESSGDGTREVNPPDAYER